MTTIGINVSIGSAATLGGGIVVAESSLIIFDGEQATLTWDAAATSVRFYEISSNGTGLDETDNAAPFSAVTGNLSSATSQSANYVFGIEVDGTLRERVTVYVLDELAFGANVGTASSAATGITQLDATISNGASPIAADSEWLLIRVVNSNIGTSYGVDNGDVTSVVVDPGGAAIQATKIWEGTAGFSAEGSSSFGITAGLWLVAHDSSIADGTTVRVNFTGAGADEATVSLEKLSKDPRTTMVVGTPADAYSPLDTRVADPPVSTASEAAVAQRVWAYHFGREGGATDAIAYDAAWTSLTQVTVGSVWEACGSRGAFRVATGTDSGDPTPSDPGASTEYATVMVAFEQQLNGATVPSP